MSGNRVSKFLLLLAGFFDFLVNVALVEMEMHLGRCLTAPPRILDGSRRHHLLRDRLGLPQTSNLFDSAGKNERHPSDGSSLHAIWWKPMERGRPSLGSFDAAVVNFHRGDSPARVACRRRHSVRYESVTALLYDCGRTISRATYKIEMASTHSLATIECSFADR